MSAYVTSLPRFMKKHTQSGAVRPGHWFSLPALVLLALIAIAFSPATQAQGSAGAQAHARCVHSGARPARVTLRHLRISTRCLFNRARARHGLRPLRVNHKLRRVATAHSRAMVRYGFFAHGSTQARIAHSGYFAAASSWAFGEVIGFGCHRDGSAKLIFRRWMRSSGHRANVLTGRFRELGVGAARSDPVGGGRTCSTFTVDLGVSL